MSALTPAAQAVMDAFTRGNPVLIEDDVYRSVCAAALGAVAKQIAPPDVEPVSDWGIYFIEGVEHAQAGILAIAAELEAPQ